MGGVEAMTLRGEGGGRWRRMRSKRYREGPSAGRGDKSGRRWDVSEVLGRLIGASGYGDPVGLLVRWWKLPGGGAPGDG